MQLLSKAAWIESGIPALVAGKVWAFTVGEHRSGVWGLGVAVANEPGFYPIPLSWCNAENYDAMAFHADALNSDEGLDKDTAARIVCSSMRALPAASQAGGCE